MVSQITRPNSTFIFCRGFSIEMEGGMISVAEVPFLTLTEQSMHHMYRHILVIWNAV